MRWHKRLDDDELAKFSLLVVAWTLMELPGVLPTNNQLLLVLVVYH